MPGRQRRPRDMPREQVVSLAPMLVALTYHLGLLCAVALYFQWQLRGLLHLYFLASCGLLLSRLGRTVELLGTYFILVLFRMHPASTL